TTVTLQQEDAARLEEETESLYRWRKEGTPFNQSCCGSVFKNPVLARDHDPAGPRTSGQFIEATGLKGLRAGGVKVSSMHANYFVNTGDGTAANVLDLMKTVRSRVAEQWGVTLEPEVKLIGSDGGGTTMDERGKSSLVMAPPIFGRTSRELKQENSCPTSLSTNPPTSTMAPSSAREPRF